jgi:hypothetical protein
VKLFILAILFSTFVNAKIRIPCSLSLFEDHKVQGGVEVLPIFPGAGYISASLGVLQMINKGKIVLERGKISKHLVMSEKVEYITVDATETNVLITTDLASDKNGHFKALASFEDLVWPISSAVPISKDAIEIDVKKLYQDLNSAGLKYGPTFQGVKEAKVYKNRADGVLHLNESLKGKGYPLHPAILDSAFHLLEAIAQNTSDKIFVPALFSKVQYYGNPTDTMYATVILERLPTPETKMIQANIFLYNDKKQLVFEMEDGIFYAKVFTQP